MAASLRFYLFSTEGVQRLSRRLIEGLIHRGDAMPQFAGTKQKAADVLLELVDGKPVKIIRADGNYLTFDENGGITQGLRDSLAESMLMSPAATIDKLTSADGTVVDLSPKLKRDKWHRENRWTLSKEELDLIADDIWDRKRLKPATIVQGKGVLKKPPKMTFDAQQALASIAVHLINIENSIETLTDPALKAVAYDSERRAKADGNNPFWVAVSQAALRRLEINSRHRSGTGVWYANIDIVLMDRSQRVGNTVDSETIKCKSKAEAEMAARQLLKKHADKFSATVELYASVVCELEWEH